MSEYQRQAEQATQLKSVQATLEHTQKKFEGMAEAARCDCKRSHDAEVAQARAERDMARAEAQADAPPDQQVTRSH
jgi:hypothetical protein